jgi:hypothetical protein
LIAIFIPLVFWGRAECSSQSLEYYNHASGEMIPLLSSGSIQKGTPSPVTFQNPASIEVSDKENVLSKFPICREIAKTIYNRVGRKMSLFTSKMMDFLFPVSYLTSHRMTDNGNSEKQAADKQHICELISKLFFIIQFYYN